MSGGGVARSFFAARGGHLCPRVAWSGTPSPCIDLLRPRVFGSVLHTEDTEASELDLLIDPTETTRLFGIGAIMGERGVPDR